VIDARDDVYEDLLIWRDLDGDGYSTTDELTRLEDVGVSSISLSARQTNYTIAGNAILWDSTFTWSDGTAGQVVDAFFQVDRSDTLSVLPEDFRYSGLSLLLPFLHIGGNLHSTTVTFSLDPALADRAAALVEMATSLDLDGFREEFRLFVFEWAGVGDIDPASRGGNVDAREVAVVEVSRSP
jgi:hypothetical protein